MAEIIVMKSPGGALVPADDEAAEFIAKMKTGQGVTGAFRKLRNVRFHRKVFNLFKLAFDAWEGHGEVEYGGVMVLKNFDRFRKDLTVLSGFYNATYTFRGDVRLEPKSLSFGAMCEEEFGRVYRAILNVIWGRVMQRKGFKSQEEVDAMVEKLLGYE